MKLKCITPKTNLQGREANGQIVNQIAQTIKTQEEEYFTNYAGGIIQKYGNE